MKLVKSWKTNLNRQHHNLTFCMRNNAKIVVKILKRISGNIKNLVVDPKVQIIIKLNKSWKKLLSYSVVLSKIVRKLSKQMLMWKIMSRPAGPF